jgi:hypothetical protein
MKVATGEIEELTEDGKNAAAVALGRKGGLPRAKNIRASVFSPRLSASAS